MYQTGREEQMRWREETLEDKQGNKDKQEITE